MDLLDEALLADYRREPGFESEEGYRGIGYTFALKRKRARAFQKRWAEWERTAVRRGMKICGDVDRVAHGSQTLRARTGEKRTFVPVGGVWMPSSARGCQHGLMLAFMERAHASPYEYA